MKLFNKKTPRAAPELYQAARETSSMLTLPNDASPFEKELFDRLRYAVPVIDAAIMKIVRLTGGFRLISSEKRYQGELDSFCETVPVGLHGKSINCFADTFLDNLLTYGSAVGEIVLNDSERTIAGLWNGDSTKIVISQGATPFDRRYAVRCADNTCKAVKHPERIVYAALTGGNSLLRGLPAISSILLRIYQCIGQNYDRVGNVRYAVTYKPTEGSGEFIQSKERAMQIAREWADGMNSAKYGQVKDFIAVGDVDIKVIGAENQLIDTEIPVRQLLEQIVAKLAIPPFLLGLTWSSTERMSSQQADILTSELWALRRTVEPVLRKICKTYLALEGLDDRVEIDWNDISLQDITEEAKADLYRAQATKYLAEAQGG